MTLFPVLSNRRWRLRRPAACTLHSPHRWRKFT